MKLELSKQNHFIDHYVSLAPCLQFKELCTHFPSTKNVEGDQHCCYELSLYCNSWHCYELIIIQALRYSLLFNVLGTHHFMVWIRYNKFRYFLCVYT